MQQTLLSSLKRGSSWSFQHQRHIQNLPSFKQTSLKPPVLAPTSITVLCLRKSQMVLKHHKAKSGTTCESNIFLLYMNFHIFIYWIAVFSELLFHFTFTKSFLNRVPVPCCVFQNIFSLQRNASNRIVKLL